jgi:HK97 family phage portal protein
MWPFNRPTAPNVVEKSIDLVEIEDLISAGPTASGVEVSAESALKVPAVAAAIRIISEAAACMEVHVVQIAGDGTESRIPNHPVRRLLSGDVNDWTTGYELIRGLVVDALRHDRGALAYVARNAGGDPVQIVRYRPGYIQVNYPDDTLRPEYRIGGIVHPNRNIIHVHGPFDKCPVTLARESIGTALSMEKHAARLFGSGAKPGGIIKTEKAIGDVGVVKMLKGWKAAHEGAENAGKTAVLWDGAQWEQMTLNSVDSQFQQLRVFQIVEIVARAFGVPPSMAGDLSRATWSNASEMQRQFLMLCLDPWLKALQSAIGRALLSDDERATHAIRFDRDDFTNVDLTARATAINSLIAARVLNPNEGREWLGLGPRDGGEVFANPNTGSSQPGAVPSTNTPPVVEDPDANA